MLVRVINGMQLKYNFEGTSLGKFTFRACYIFKVFLLNDVEGVIQTKFKNKSARREKFFFTYYINDFATNLKNKKS